MEPFWPILTPFFNTTFTIPPELAASNFAEGVLNTSIFRILAGGKLLKIDAIS
jgi:hypothetical protein